MDQKHKNSQIKKFKYIRNMKNIKTSLVIKEMQITLWEMSKEVLYQGVNDKE